MPRTDVNGIQIAYEARGASGRATVLLLPGAGRQLIEWPPELIDLITAAGYRTIAIDHRDSGLSTHFTSAGKVPVSQILDLSDGSSSGWPTGRPPYTLDDMAADAVGVLDALGVAEAHIVGFSLGGAVAQQMALTHPQRVLSLSSLASSTGDPDVGRPDPAGVRALLRSPPPDRDGAVAADIERRRVEAPSNSFDEARAAERAAAAYDRDFDPAGTARQLAALRAAGDRTSRLREITVPTLVVHGAADRIVDVSGGEATAAAIQGARLVVIPEAGHELAAPFVDDLADELIRHFRSAHAVNEEQAGTG